MLANKKINSQIIDTLPASVFRAYDIRGKVGEELTEDGFYTLGRAIGAQLQCEGGHEIVLGFDGRQSSYCFSEALQLGLLNSGINVTNVGLVPSPLLYFATHHLAVDSGLVVTGSHNPREYNGIKMVLKGRTLAQEEITGLYHRIINQQFVEGTGHTKKIDINKAYIRDVCARVDLKRALKVVIDCGNGVAGNMAVELFSAVGCTVVPLYCDVDGTFPNHHPDPTVEKNLIDLKDAVKKHKADIGLAFDGDGDRLGVVTEKGETIWPDRQLMLYAIDILSRNPNAKIVYDVKCSAHLAKVIEDHGGQALMCPTGHSLVKAKMKEEGALLAGEMSGHIFFKERWYGFDDGLYTAARLLEIISQNNASVSEQFKAIPDSINTPEIKIPLADDKKFSLIKALSDSSVFDKEKCIFIDGVRVEFKNGWGLVRASNTTPCLVARFEADSQEALALIQSRFKQELLALDKSLDIPF